MCSSIIHCCCKNAENEEKFRYCNFRTVVRQNATTIYRHMCHQRSALTTQINQSNFSFQLIFAILFQSSQWPCHYYHLTASFAHVAFWACKSELSYAFLVFKHRIYGEEAQVIDSITNTFSVLQSFIIKFIIIQITWHSNHLRFVHTLTRSVIFTKKTWWRYGTFELNLSTLLSLQFWSASES